MHSLLQVVCFASWLTVISACAFPWKLNKLKLCFPDPEVCMNASELIVSKGYPCDDYTVQTEDGFLIGLQRIRHGLGEEDARRGNEEKKPVVFLQHGLLCSSTNWLTNLVNESFGFILADAGFDVWMGNVRGNTYGRKHVRYSPKDARFWDWSWDEMAKYDLPAMIDFVLKTSGVPKLFYIGHSQGTLMAFAHASRNASFANKIELFFAMGPVATTHHIRGPLKILSYFTRQIQDLLWLFGVHEFLPNSEIIKLLGMTVCDAETRIFCEDILFIVAGFDQKQLNMSRLPVYLNHVPAGTSVRNIVHFAQMVRSGKFCMYDYGSARRNRAHYGQSSPPLYDLSKVKIPIVLLSGGNDWLADPKDVKWLASRLPNVVEHRQIADWDHLDFIWAMDAPRLIYNPIIKRMKKMTKMKTV